MSDIARIRLVFLLQPLCLGAWFPRIPQVQATIGLDEGMLALALVGMPLGLLTALSFGSRVAEALGTRGLLTIGMGSYLVTLPLAAFAPTWLALFAGLAVAGVCMALAQLSLNVTASEVEARSPRPIMNGCHGYWAVGVLIGSAVGSALAELRVAPGIALALVAAVCFAPLLLVARGITDYALPAPPKPASGRRRLSRPLMLIAVFGFGVATTEGAMADWLAVYMTNVFSASPGVAGSGYTVFALCIALGRFLGDWLKTMMPVDKLAQSLVGLAIAGLLVALLSPTLWLVFAGVAMLGLGVSLGFPLAVSAASRLEGRSSAGNVAVLTQMTLCGFLVGPPVIGGVAQITDIRFGLAALLSVLVAAFFAAPALRPNTLPVAAPGEGPFPNRRRS